LEERARQASHEKDREPHGSFSRASPASKPSDTLPSTQEASSTSATSPTVSGNKFSSTAGVVRPKFSFAAAAGASKTTADSQKELAVPIDHSADPVPTGDAKLVDDLSNRVAGTTI
jgi:hypothetical protein